MNPWRPRRARRKAARARLWRREAMGLTVELILNAERWVIDRVIADLERQIQDAQADTE